MPTRPGRHAATGMSSSLPQLVAVTKATLAAVPGWRDGKGVELDELCSLIDEWDSDDEEDDEAFYDAIDALEADGWLKVDNGEETDTLYSTEVALAPQAAAGNYDFAAEAAAADTVMQCVAKLKCWGVDKDDVAYRQALTSACGELAFRVENSPAPPLRDDDKLLGDWQLVGTTSSDLAERKGLTGLGAAPLTSPVALFYSFQPDGSVTAKEVLNFFGRPVILNELRGKMSFDESGRWMQETYESADLSGVANSPQFTSATATTKGVCITQDGRLRVQFANEWFFVFKKLEEGELQAWLQERKLPWVGGTVATLDTAAVAKAYPYLGMESDGGKKDGGWNPFG